MTPDRPARGIALMIAGMAVLSTLDAVGKFATETYPVSQVLFLRFAIFLAFALAVAARKGGLRATLRSENPRLQVFRSLLLALEMWLFVFVISKLPLADVHAVAAVSPLVATALAVPLLGERVGPWRWAAVLMGFVGTLVVIRPGVGVFEPLTVLPLVAACAWAWYQVLVRKLRRDPPETTLLYTAIVGFLVWGLSVPFAWQPPDTEGWLLLGAIGLLGIGAHGLLILALSAAPSALLQPFNYTVLIWATLWGWVGFGAFPDGWTITGAAIVVASGLFAIWREHRRRPLAHPRPFGAKMSEGRSGDRRR